MPEGPDRAGCDPRIRGKDRSDFCYGLHRRSRGGCPGRYRCHNVLLQVGMVQAMEGPPGSHNKVEDKGYGCCPDPVKVKGLTKPLTLLWDGVGGKFQLVVLPTLHDVDVVLGVDVLSQLNIQFDLVKQVVRPYREPSTPVASARNIELLFKNPYSTFKGKIPVKEEGVKEVAKDMLRPAYQDIRFCYKTKEKEEDHKIVWNQADYKVQLKEDLEDIRQKLCRVLG